MSKRKSYTVTFPPELWEALHAQVDGYNANLAPGDPSQSFHGEVLTRLYQSINPESPPVVGGSRRVSKPAKVHRKRRAVRGPQLKLAVVS